MKARAILGLGLAAVLALAPAASASVRCHHSPPPAAELRVVPYEDPRIDLDFADGTVRREGHRILVEELGEEVDCSGPTSTVANTVTIVFLQGGLSFSSLDLSGGLPAPHIEFRSELGALGFGSVTGTKGPDEWLLGGTTTAVGLAIDPAAPENLPIVWDGLGTNVPALEPGAGDDTVDASAILRRHTTALIKGGEGNDTLLGSPFGDGIEGGPGRDLLSGGGGNDELDGRDADQDRLDCGPGAKDRAHPGRGDSLRGCEKVERPGHRHLGRPPKPPGLPGQRTLSRG
jgi:hypothetical protein